jgi:hypothetical protein
MDVMMHDAMMHKRKRTSNSNMGVTLGRYKELRISRSLCSAQISV